MKQLQILEINKFNSFVLKDIHSKEIHNFVLDFLIDEKPQAGDMLAFNEILLNKKSESYSGQYTFGDLKSIYGRNITDKNDPDLAFVKIKDKTITLKRLYG